jgi:hypothetical protein
MGSAQERCAKLVETRFQSVADGSTSPQPSVLNVWKGSTSAILHLRESVSFTPTADNRRLN